MLAGMTKPVCQPWRAIYTIADSETVIGVLFIAWGFVEQADKTKRGIRKDRMYNLVGNRHCEPPRGDDLPEMRKIVF